MGRRTVVIAIFLVVMLSLSYILLSRGSSSFSLSTDTLPFQNGGFESGSLVPWYTIGTGSAVSTGHVHSGTYSASFNVLPDDITGIQQNFTPIALPVTVSAYFYNVQYPAPYSASCHHPYTQWTIVDTTGHVLEAGFSGAQPASGISSGQAWLVAYTGYNMVWLSSQPTNQWIRITVAIYQDQLKFYLNDVEVSLRPQPSNPWSFSSVKSIQLIASCSAVVYIDDVQIGGSNPTNAIYYVRDNANNRYQVANGESVRVIPPVSFEVNIGSLQNVQSVRVNVDGSAYTMTSEGSSMYGSASIPLSAGSHTVQFQYQTGGSWNVLAVITLSGGSESPTDQGTYALAIVILIVAIALLIYKRRTA